MSNEDFDPFAGSASIPSISFNNEPIGTVKSLTVTEYATTAQSRDYNTKELAFWENKDGTKSPKMSAVLKGVDDNGEPISLWASIPSALLAAIGDAQKAVDPKYRVKPGDKVYVKFIGEKPTKASPQKLYAAKIEVGTAPPPVTDDPWASSGSSSAPAAGTVPFDDTPPF